MQNVFLAHLVMHPMKARAGYRHMLPFITMGRPGLRGVIHLDAQGNV